MDQFLEFFSTHFAEEIFQVNIGAFINLKKFCLTNIFFVFVDQYFKQIFDASMENKLRPVVSRLWKEFLKSLLVLNIPTLMKLYARYVDDIFWLFPNDHNPDNYLISLYMLSHY